ncbi:MAG: transposase, family protein [Proteobacteria bacterium]|nr:transposase, family protein [Pseudomonadota bacterium]
MTVIHDANAKIFPPALRLRKTRFPGLRKVKAQMVFTFAACNLTRMASQFGWRWSTA